MSNGMDKCRSPKIWCAGPDTEVGWRGGYIKTVVSPMTYSVRICRVYPAKFKPEVPVPQNWGGVVNNTSPT